MLTNDLAFIEIVLVYNVLNGCFDLLCCMAHHFFHANNENLFLVRLEDQLGREA